MCTDQLEIVLCTNCQRKVISGVELQYLKLGVSCHCFWILKKYGLAMSVVIAHHTLNFGEARLVLKFSEPQKMVLYRFTNMKYEFITKCY